MVGLALVLLVMLGFRLSTRVNWNFGKSIGTPLDSLDGVAVYYNGGVNQSHGRNTVNGYNVGIKYQCVEFVKRYYLEVFHHQMPDPYGNAKDFFDPTVGDGELNPARGLLQFQNGSTFLPRQGDLLVWGPSTWNPYGHVAIVSAIQGTMIEVIQQNPGPFGDSRAKILFEKTANGHRLAEDRILGWLRKP